MGQYLERRDLFWTIWRGLLCFDLRFTSCTLAKAVLWIKITFIYLTMNVFIQRIALLSVGIWLICMCSDNIHKLENPRDTKVISFPQSEVVSKFLHLWRCCSGNELCLHQTPDVRLTCPDIFKGKDITFLFQWAKLIKMPPLYSGAFKESFSLAVNENKGKDERNHFLKETERPTQRHA